MGEKKKKKSILVGVVKAEIIIIEYSHANFFGLWISL